MINIIKQEINVDIELKKRIDFICEFYNTTPTFINGSIRNIDKTNINYIEPHKVIIAKFQFKKSVIENHLCNFINEIIEYDSVVNQFFLPMIKQKIKNHKEELQKQLNKQRIKFDRIKKAYINGTFTLDEYEQERKLIENNINDLKINLMYVIL